MCRFIDEVPLFVWDDEQAEALLFTQVRMSPEGQLIASLLVSSTLKLIVYNLRFAMSLIEYYIFAVPIVSIVVKTTLLIIT